jgi:hypothetical protein
MALDVVLIVERSTAALRDLRNKKKIDLAVYGKQIVRLAGIYTNAGLMLQALELVRSVPLEYYTDHQLSQLLSDEVYAEDAALVADALVASGLLEEPAAVQVNVPAGSA